MKSFVAVPALLMRLGVKSGLAPHAQATPPDPTTRPAPPATSQPAATRPAATQPAAAGDRREVVDVSTAEEFVGAIGSDRVVRLAPGESVLSDVADRSMEFVRWDRKFDGKTLTVRNVRNMAIVGRGDKPVRLVVRPAYVFVLNFEGCQGVNLSNLSLGHAPERGHCDSGVVGAADCSGLAFSGCDLFGCGTEGLTLRNVKGMRFEDSVIRDCTYGVMTAAGCADLSFARSRFTGNERYWGISLSDSRGVSFTDCVVEGNTVEGEPLFRVTSCSGVRFEGGAVRGNRAAGLADGPGKVAFEGTVVERNRLDEE